MELDGKYVLDATPQEVWDALFDRDVLAKSIPGCQELEQTSDTTFNAIVKLKVGPVSAKFKGDVELSDADEPKSCTLTGRGAGGLAGFASGSAKVVLEETPQGTELTYTAMAKVGGKLAALGSRLIRATSRKLADEFFAKFSEIVAPASISSTTEHQEEGAV